MSAIDELATEFARLPGIGRKTALRLTYHLLRQPPEQVRRLGQAVLVLGERVHRCERCFNYTDEALCVVCRDPRRDPAVVCVVEEASDIGAIERAGEYRGVYHVLGGRLSPIDGVGPEDLTVDRLVARVESGGQVREVIIATNPSLEGEATALLVRHALAAAGAGDVVISRIALGLPVGGDLEYADGVTIARALSARRAM